MADANKAVNKKNNQKHNTERVKNHRHRKSTEEREGNGKFDSRNRYLPKRDSIRDENNFRRRGIMQGNGNPSFYQEPMAIVPQGSYPNHYPEPGFNYSSVNDSITVTVRSSVRRPSYQHYGPQYGLQPDLLPHVTHPPLHFRM